MPLNSSKFVIFTLIVILISGCSGKLPETKGSTQQTIAVTASPTIAITPFPTSPPPTKTFFPTETISAAPSSTKTPTTTPFPTNVPVIPDPDSYSWVVVAEGLSRLTGIAFPEDDSDRLFVLEQDGLIQIIQSGTILPVPFLDLRDRASTQGSTVRGLLGMTFHPKYVENGYFFVHYTQKGGNSVIARYQVSSDPNLANPDSETRLLEVSYPIGEHTGGDLAFGPGGDLYISIGDGGAGGYNDEAGNAQNPDAFPGSLLRMDVDNGLEPEIWLIGLRNPLAFQF